MHVPVVHILLHPDLLFVPLIYQETMENNMLLYQRVMERIEFKTESYEKG